MKYLKYLMVFIPISIICELLKVGPVYIFILAALSIVPLAGVIGEATEEISVYAGPRIGGFLNNLQVAFV